jgi:hypothetical protein
MTLPMGVWQEGSRKRGYAGCNIMLPLAAFPIHYCPAAYCHSIPSGLDCQIRLSEAA